MSTVRIIIADDHAIVRTGLRDIFARAPDMRIVAEADNGHALLEQLQRQPCDIVLQDMTMPGLSGIELLRRIRESHPQVPVLVLTMHNEGQVASRALKAGAAGYITKDSDPELLVAAVRKIIRGGNFIDPALVDKIVFDVGLQRGMLPHETLSEREAQIFRLLVAGGTTGEISARLALSAKTVSTYKARILQKIGVPNVVGLVRYAVEHELGE